MAMTKEAKVKNKVKQILNEHDAYYFMPAGGAFGKNGIPDFIVCFQDHFIAVECKTVGGVVTPLQEKQLTQIQKHGGHPLVINETNYDELVYLLKTLKK